MAAFFILLSFRAWPGIQFNPTQPTFFKRWCVGMPPRSGTNLSHSFPFSKKLTDMYNVVYKIFRYFKSPLGSKQ